MTLHGARGAETQTMHTSVALHTPCSCVPQDVYVDMYTIPGIFQHVEVFQGTHGYTVILPKALFCAPSSCVAQIKGGGD